MSRRKNKDENEFPHITGPSRLRAPSPGIRLVSNVSHRDILWKTGDLVSVIEEEVKYFAQIRAIVLSRLSLPGCLVRWLLPGDDDKWLPGPDEEMPIDLACLTPEGSPPDYLEKLEDVPYNDSQWSQLRVDAQR